MTAETSHHVFVCGAFFCIAQYDFAPPDMLEDNEIEMILERADALVSWAADVKEYALSQALSGKQWNGYKVVEGKSNRRYTDEKLVAEAVKAAGKNPYSEPEVLGITAMTKLLGGKKKFDELLSKYVCKPQGKPTLVPMTELDLLTIGLINDMFTERENDDYDGWNEMASQSDFDAF